MQIKTSVLDYLGKIEGSIIVLVSFVLNDKYYEGMFVYTNEKISLTTDDSLENDLGCKIEKHEEYTDILRFLIKNVVPWNEMITRIDELDLSIFEQRTSDVVYLAGDVSSSEISFGTQSLI